jgi:hypothetical protein
MVAEVVAEVQMVQVQMVQSLGLPLQLQPLPLRPQ